MMDQPIYCCCGGHGILEDPIPLTEDQVGGDLQAAPFVPLGKESEQHLHFFTALLHITDVVQYHDLEAVKLLEHLFDFQLTFGNQ